MESREQKIPQAILDIPIPDDADEEYYRPPITSAAELAEEVEALYVIHNYMDDINKYDALIEHIYDLVKASFEIRECRTFPIKFKFYPKDTKIHTLEIRHFLINLHMWRPLTDVYAWPNVMNENYIFDAVSGTTMKNFDKYLNEYPIRTLREYNIKTDVSNEKIAKLLHGLVTITADFSNILGLTFSAETFMQMYDKYPRFRELITTHFSKDQQPIEIEKQINALTAELVEIFKNDPGNPIGTILEAGTGIKIKQLWEFLGSEGLNPDINGKTIPYPINSNTLLGTTSPAEIWIKAIGARKSLIMNKLVMGDAGHFSKIVWIIALTLPLSRMRYDCGSVHLVRREIKSKDVLKKYHNRYYRRSGGSSLECLDASKDEDLIGQTIYLRSPITCCNGDGVCHVCYGKNAILGLDIAEGISGFSAQEITKVIEQLILSVKHLLTTNSEKIEFNQRFYDFFTIQSDTIVPNLTSDDSDIDINDWEIVINPDDIKKVEELDVDTSYNTMIPSGRFYVRNLKTGETISMAPNSAKELYLGNGILDHASNKKYSVKFRDLEEDDPIFHIDIMNNELTKPLYDIINLLSSMDHNYTIDEVVEYFSDLLINSGIDALSLQAELILSTLIRDPDNLMKKPDFSSKKLPKYTILSVNSAIENFDSPLLPLGYQNIKKHLLSDSTFYEKRGNSYVDDLYRKNVDMNLGW